LSKIIGLVVLSLGLNRFLVKPVNKWSNEIVVITGGSHGLGKAIALELKAKGANVIVIDIMECEQGKGDV
jgi:5,10-methylene-tetrahydrofolate dehydrogenase/methenyl tetrahydrofolate cyclohydrolase